MNLKKQYDAFQLDVSLNLVPGRITGLIGKNGSGKTTIYKILMGLVKNEGEALSLDKKEMVAVWNESGFNSLFTPKDCKKILQAIYPHFDEGAYSQRLKQLDLPENKPIKQFSTGMKAKLKICIVTSVGAKHLLLDEPTSGLDSLARRELSDLLQDYMETREDASILISSHISSDLESLCDDFYLLEEGKILLHEDTDVLLSNYALLEVDDPSKLDTSYILKEKDHVYLTNQKQYYAENMSGVALRNAHFDELLEWMVQGENV